MKKILILSSFLFAAVMLSSFTYHHHSHAGGLLPGQAKKITGSKSAKPYAPGQQKKH